LYSTAKHVLVPCENDVTDDVLSAQTLRMYVVVAIGYTKVQMVWQTTEPNGWFGSVWFGSQCLQMPKAPNRIINLTPKMEPLKKSHATSHCLQKTYKGLRPCL